MGFEARINKSLALRMQLHSNWAGRTGRRRIKVIGFAAELECRCGGLLVALESLRWGLGMICN